MIGARSGDVVFVGCHDWSLASGVTVFLYRKESASACYEMHPVGYDALHDRLSIHHLHIIYSPSRQ